MGTWGTKTFGSDGAYDWYDFFCESNQALKILEYLFGTVLFEGSNELEKNSYLSKYIQVAGEIVAYLNGHPCINFPDEIYHGESGDIDGFVPFIKKEKLASRLDQKLKDKAVMALNKLLESDSPNIRLSWSEPSLYEEWKLVIQDLIDRIKK